ncbi:MAG: PAS domain S-box protein [Gallionellaceae bacterium]
MKASLVEIQPQDNARNLRMRAESRFKKELALNTPSRQSDLLLQFNELRISQIEIELLSEEFNKLRIQKLSNTRETPLRSGYFILDRRGRISYAKFTSACNSKTKAAKWKGRSLFDYLRPETKDELHQFLTETFKSESRTSCELSFENGSRKNKCDLKLPLHALIKAIADNDNQYCLAVVEDISERKLAESKDKANNLAIAMLNQTIAASRNEIYMFDADTLRFDFANQVALENLGYTLPELQWMTPVDIQNNIFNQELGDQTAYLLKHKKSDKIIHAVHLRRDGSVYPVEIYLQLFEHELSRSFIAIVQDVSSQAAIESQLKSIVESASAIIWGTDAKMKLTFISDQVRDILGYSAKHFIGYSFAELIAAGVFHEEDKALLSEAFVRVTQDGSNVTDLRCRALRADGCVNAK